MSVVMPDPAACDQICCLAEACNFFPSVGSQWDVADEQCRNIHFLLTVDINSTLCSMFAGESNQLQSFQNPCTLTQGVDDRPHRLYS